MKSEEFKKLLSRIYFLQDFWGIVADVAVLLDEGKLSFEKRLVNIDQILRDDNSFLDDGRKNLEELVLYLADTSFPEKEEES